MTLVRIFPDFIRYSDVVGIALLMGWISDSKDNKRLHEITWEAKNILIFKSCLVHTFQIFKGSEFMLLLRGVTAPVL